MSSDGDRRVRRIVVAHRKSKAREIHRVGFVRSLHRLLPGGDVAVILANADKRTGAFPITEAFAEYIDTALRIEIPDDCRRGIARAKKVAVELFNLLERDRLNCLGLLLKRSRVPWVISRIVGPRNPCIEIRPERLRISFLLLQSG